MTWIILGELGKPFQLDGWQRLVSYTDPPEKIFEYLPCIVLDAHDQPFSTLQEIKPHGRGFVARCETAQSIDDARSFGLHRVAIEREKIPPLPSDEYFWQDLIGMSVINHGIPIGKVTHMARSSAYDLLVIQLDKQEVWIPFTAEYVTEIDPQNHTLITAWDLD